jgi:hypothetical protein
VFRTNRDNMIKADRTQSMGHQISGLRVSPKLLEHRLIDRNVMAVLCDGSPDVPDNLDARDRPGDGVRELEWQFHPIHISEIRGIAVEINLGIVLSMGH